MIRGVTIELNRVAADPGPVTRLEAELATLLAAGPVRLPAPAH